MEILSINDKREELLAPLLEWRILGVSELGELGNYQKSERGLRKIIERSEKSGLINSFIHKLSNRKFVYLSRRAYQEMTDASWNVNEEIKMHDAIVACIIYRFSKMNTVDLAKMNYQNIAFNQSIFAHGVDPDGMIRAKRRGDVYNIAIEVELNRKSSTEIFRKFKLYHENTAFTWAVYFFNNRRVLNAYFAYYKKFREESYIPMEKSQMMFCYSDKMAMKEFNPLECYWKRPDGVDSTLKEFFYG